MMNRPPHRRPTPKGIRSTAFAFALVLAVVGLGAAAVVHAQPGSAGAASREERLRQHRERIAKILEERRAQEAKNQPAAGANPADPSGAAAGAPGASATAGAPTSNPSAQPAPGGEARPPVPDGFAGGPAPARPPGAPATAGAARTEARSILALFPFDSTILAGEVFETEVVADVRQGTADSVSFTLQWPPDDLNPLALDHDYLASLGVEEFEYGIDAEKGLLAAVIKFPKPVALNGQPLVKVVWEGLRPAKAAMLRFQFGGSVPTEIRSGGENLLGTSFTPDDGVLHSVVLIRPRGPVVTAARTRDGGVILGAKTPPPPSARARLLLEADRASLRTGDVLLVNVVLDNPRATPFDRLRLYIQFLPGHLEVLDTDRGNSIRTGINIREAPDRFPFDFLRENVADQRSGIIRYDAGMESGALETTGGIVAQVAFRALRAGQPIITLVENADGLSPTTDILLNSVSILDTPIRGLRPRSVSGLIPVVSGPDLRTNVALDTSGRSPQPVRSSSIFSSGLGKDRQFRPGQ